MMQRALFVVLGALVGYLLYGAYAAFGIAAIAINMLTAVPATYLGMRFGPAYAWTTVALTGLLVFLDSSQSALLIYLLQFGVPAGMLAWLLRRGVAWDRAVLATLGGIVAASLVSLILIAVAQGVTPVELAGSIVDKEVVQTEIVMQDFFANADLPQDEVEDVTEALSRMSEFMRDVYAGLTITVSLFMLLSLILFLTLMARGSYTVPGVAFPSWKAPEGLIWVLITAGFVALFVEGVANILAMNLLVILLPVYFLQGLAIIDNFFRRKALSPLLRIAGYLLVVLVNPLPLLVTCVGVFDLWVDFRKPRTSSS